ncbi:hypothetical protein J4438_02785 [Candidatus Woesearchaeota archaeon]|nr:hypothetical protein [Candidatus Woesearchaeota archaeon]
MKPRLLNDNSPLEDKLFNLLLRDGSLDKDQIAGRLYIYQGNLVQQLRDLEKWSTWLTSYFERPEYESLVKTDPTRAELYRVYDIDTCSHRIIRKLKQLKYLRWY